MWPFRKMSKIEKPNVDELRRKKVVYELIEALRDGNRGGCYSSECIDATKSLIKIGMPAVKPLIKLLGDSEDLLNWQVSKVLERIGMPAVEPLIKALLRDEDEDVRRGAAEVLGNISDKRAVEPLINASGDEYYAVRVHAAAALGKIGDPRAIPALENATNDSDKNVRRVAREALDDIKSSYAYRDYLRQREAEKRAKQVIDSTRSKIKEAEKLGINVLNARDLHKKAIFEFDNGGYEKAIEYAEKCKKAADERRTGYDLAAKLVSEAEKIVNKIRSTGMEVSDELLIKSKQALDDGDYEETIKYAKQSEEIVKKIQEENKPEITLNFPEETFPPNQWKKIDVTIRNTGSMHAKEIDIEPSGDIEFRRIPTIPQLNTKETEAITIAMKPTIAGDVPIDIVLTYKDALDRDYKSSEGVWIPVAEYASEQNPPLTPPLQPEPEPISPSDFTPRPTTPSTFPPELAHLYSDPVYAGKGGFARVFQAKRKTDNKIVAIKIPISLDESTGRSFLREITSWQRLEHENIITLYDANILPIPYLEMEYAGAGSLDQMNKPVDVDTASEIILEIAEGLSYSHAQGVIHRDLKPMNVLLTEDLTPKISDWGLSKIIAESKTSSIYGFSPLYGSPEQISPKKFGKPDERIDIYQLGVIFYELLTGRTPFEGDDLVEVSTAIVTEEPVPPSSTNPEAEIIDPIILKCLAKKKEDRYQKIGELHNDLASALKTQLKESLKMSVSEHNMKRSALYCAEICLINARLGEIDDAIMYLTDMQNYASEDVKTEVAELLEELERRKGMSSKEKISEEFVGRLKNVLHQVRMGR